MTEVPAFVVALIEYLNGRIKENEQMIKDVYGKKIWKKYKKECEKEDLRSKNIEEGSDETT